MPALEHIQSAMMQALDHGPEYLPEHLFTGDRDRILAGMKVHANTISHARLIALEDTFPRTREWLGQTEFNHLSRCYLEQPGVSALSLMRIGEAFVPFLLKPEADGTSADLARFEWLWLESYHATDAAALRLADLAGIEPAELIDIRVAAHPAAALDHFGAEARNLLNVEVPGLLDGPGILITRPDAQVLVATASIAMSVLFNAAKIPVTIGNLLAVVSEPACKDRVPASDFMPALIELLEAGSLVRVQGKGLVE